MENKIYKTIKYRDRVYGDVVIDEPVIVELIECPAMLRLVGIDQSGHFEPFYPGTFQSRYEHSVGVYILLRNYGAPIEEQIAGLIHDVSHSAFSHCIDYVIDGASPSEQDHQDNIFEKFVKKTDIPRILKKYGFNIDYILNDGNFPLKENKLPDLCADRIDYSLRTALVFREIASAAGFLNKLRAGNGRWYFTDKLAAQEFAGIFLKLNSKYYASLLSAVMFASVGDYLRYSLGKGYIKSADLYSTDREVLQKIARFHRYDRHLRKLLSRMDNKAAFANSAADHDAKIVCKSRAVDPLFKDGRKLVRLSQADKSWAGIIKRESKPKTYFIKFGRRWWLPSKVNMTKDPFVFLFLIGVVAAAAIMFSSVLNPGWQGPNRGVVLDPGSGGLSGNAGGNSVTPVACGIENCHGVDVVCGAKVADVCTEIYMVGDGCRRFAECAIADGQCQLVSNQKLENCRACVAGCVQDFADDQMGLFDCDSKCAGIDGAETATSQAAEISRKRSIIESLYPKLNDFESQNSFAGQRVKTEINGTDYYFAYITEGSGVPIVSAICFKVDEESKIYYIGELNDSGVAGNGIYRDIDPITCEGVK